jgi:hypothetical protein
MNTARNFGTVNTEDNTRDNSILKAKGGAAQYFQKRDNLLVLIKLQRTIKKFLRTNPRQSYKRNHFANNSNSVMRFINLAKLPK